MEAKETTLKELGEMLAHVVEHMATKDDIVQLRTEMHEGFADIRAEMHEGFADIRSELKDIRNRLDALEAAVRNISGYAKEIDHLMERVKAIEKHLGIEKRIAA